MLLQAHGLCEEALQQVFRAVSFPKSAMHLVHGGDSHQLQTDNTWKLFSAAVCAAICVLQNYLNWRNLLKQQMTSCSSSSSRTIIFSLDFYHQNLTIIITFARNIIIENYYQ